MTDAEIIETLNNITKLQAEVIDQLFRDLSQHMAAKELDEMKVLDKINEAAKLKADLSRRTGI